MNSYLYRQQALFEHVREQKLAVPRLALLVETDDDLDGSVLAVDVHNLAVAEGLVEDGVSRLQSVEFLLRDDRGLAPL